MTENLSVGDRVHALVNAAGLPSPGGTCWSARVVEVSEDGRFVKVKLRGPAYWLPIGAVRRAAGGVA